MRRNEVLLKIFKALLKAYGPRHWWPAKTRFEVIIGAILTQNVTWKNAKDSVDSLREAGMLSAEKIIKAPQRKLAFRIKSSRFYNQKAKNLKAFCSYLMKENQGSLNMMFAKDMDILRKELLGLRGIGQETADCILLYAGKKPSFVSDAYTKRLLKRYGLINKELPYADIRRFFMDNLPEDTYIYNEFHALIVRHGHLTCKSKPACSACPIKSVDKNIYCKFGGKN